MFSDRPWRTVPRGDWVLPRPVLDASHRAASRRPTFVVCRRRSSTGRPDPAWRYVVQSIGDSVSAHRRRAGFAPAGAVRGVVPGGAFAHPDREGAMHLDGGVLVQEVATPMMDDMSGLRGNLVRRVDELQRRRRVIGFPSPSSSATARTTAAGSDRSSPTTGSSRCTRCSSCSSPSPPGSSGTVRRHCNGCSRRCGRRCPFVDRRVSPPRSTSRSRVSQGQVWVLVLSLLVTMWGRVGVVRVLQDTVNTIWGVPRYRRPRFFASCAAGSPSSRCSASASSARRWSPASRSTVDLPLVAACAAAVANIALAAAIAVALYHLTIGTSVRTSECCPVPSSRASGTYAITLVGGLYVKHVIARMSGVYGRSPARSDCWPT